MSCSHLAMYKQLPASHASRMRWYSLPRTQLRSSLQAKEPHRGLSSGTHHQTPFNYELPRDRERYNPQNDDVKGRANRSLRSQPSHGSVSWDPWLGKVRAASKSLRMGYLFREPSGKPNYSPIALRKACTCPKCVNPSDRQKNYSSADIPTNLRVKSFHRDDLGNYTVTWANDVPGYEDHVSEYSAERIRDWMWLEERSRTSYTLLERFLWDRSSYLVEEATIPYTQFISESQGLADVMRSLWRTGMVFISDVPRDETSVSKMADRIGGFRNSFYGPTWDVRSVPNAKNVAYTDRNLGFHMDLLYMKDPPGFQLLHCLENTCSGGESQFADTFKALDKLYSQPRGPDFIKTLMDCRIRYGYSNDGHYYTKKWPTVEGNLPMNCKYVNAENPDLLSRIKRVYWSPPFESDEPNIFGFQEKENTEARKHFADILQSDSMIFETKLEAGTCVIFDNLRVVHARKAFDVNSGQRWLKGAYVNQEDMTSVMRRIKHLLPEEEMEFVDHHKPKPETPFVFSHDTLLQAIEKPV